MRSNNKSPVMDQMKPRDNPPGAGHKVVIYFGDSLNHRKGSEKTPHNGVCDTQSETENDFAHVQRLFDEIQMQKRGVINDFERDSQNTKFSSTSTLQLPVPEDNSYQEREDILDNRAFNIQIEGTFRRTSELVKSIATSYSDFERDVEPQDEHLDWSFVQEWRLRSPMNQERQSSENGCSHVQQLRDKQYNTERTVSIYPGRWPQDIGTATSAECNKSGGERTISERVMNGLNLRTGRTYQKNSCGNDSPKVSVTSRYNELYFCQGSQEFQNSSDENRSSGRASMSDTCGRGSDSIPPDTHETESTGLHEAPQNYSPWLQTGSNTKAIFDAESESSEVIQVIRRAPSLDTLNTNVTSADEFIWVDAHNRLVELQTLPWTTDVILRVVRSGRCREHASQILDDIIPRLGYLLQRPLVRIAKEVQRFSSGIGLCSKPEVIGALRVVLPPNLADSCIKACLRSVTMFSIPGESIHKQSKSSRAGLKLHIGRFHKWMTNFRLGKFIHEHAAVCFCAGIENLLEELLLQALPTERTNKLSSLELERFITNSADFWGLLQPFAHLNAGRNGSGALTLPKCIKKYTRISQPDNEGVIEPCLLTTCVGSFSELQNLLSRANRKYSYIPLSNSATQALFYYMRCSQLEQTGTMHSMKASHNSQELCYEKAYLILPPLVEWLRVSSAHAEYRHASFTDKDDVMQAARLLLPGIDSPPRTFGYEEDVTATARLHHSGSEKMIKETGEKARISLAFQIMLCGSPELIGLATTLLPSSSLFNTLNSFGMTTLMIAAVRNDDIVLRNLLKAGADPNVEVPIIGHAHCPSIHPDTQYWTALTFAACAGSFKAVRILLEAGAKVEGGFRLTEERCTLTPLQVASASENVEIVSTLLKHGADPFLSTQRENLFCSTGVAQYGCFNSICVAAAHGQISSLRKLLSYPTKPCTADILSLEEILAESDNNDPNFSRINSDSKTPVTKSHMKCLQEAMFQSTENGNLDITLELRAMGISWTIHSWTDALAFAYEQRSFGVIDQLLKEFSEVSPDEYNYQFISECLPLLFNIFKLTISDCTISLLAKIFQMTFGSASIKPIKGPRQQNVNLNRIDPKFINNPDLSDVIFKVDGKTFYGHKIVLVTASPKLQSLLGPKINDKSTLTIELKDMRYEVFVIVMQFLYYGSCTNLNIPDSDILELMAAASFFELEELVQYTEVRCARIVGKQNIVPMYIHAQAYNASKLMEYCQAYLLQNMCSLLEENEFVKRLLFSKKIPHHDVLTGLLSTLQARIKTKKTLRKQLK